MEKVFKLYQLDFVLIFFEIRSKYRYFSLQTHFSLNPVRFVDSKYEKRYTIQKMMQNKTNGR